MKTKNYLKVYRGLYDIPDITPRQILYISEVLSFTENKKQCFYSNNKFAIALAIGKRNLIKLQNDLIKKKYIQFEMKNNNGYIYDKSIVPTEKLINIINENENGIDKPQPKVDKPQPKVDKPQPKVNKPQPIIEEPIQTSNEVQNSEVKEEQVDDTTQEKESFKTPENGIDDTVNEPVNEGVINDKKIKKEIWERYLKIRNEIIDDENMKTKCDELMINKIKNDIEIYGIIGANQRNSVMIFKNNIQSFIFRKILMYK